MEGDKVSRGIKAAIGLCAAAAVLLGLLLWINEDIPARPADAAETNGQPLEKSWLDERAIVVVDAGHGGIDPGAVSADGTVLEADVTQLVADKVMEKLAAHTGQVRVAEACTPGVYATPMARANTAASLEADVFVSLHLNADIYASTRGFQCFPAPPGRVHHDESLRLAECLVARAGETGIPILGESGVFYAYYYSAAGGYGKVIYDAAQSPEPRDDESFGVIEYPGCPAVLVEMWHISNAADMRAFNHESGHDAMAQAVYLALCDYLKIEPMA